MQSFVRAWRAACDFKGRSRLLIPGGTFLLSEIVFAGPCSGPAPKIVQVIGTVKATTDVSEYSSSEWVLFESINGLVISGRGTFDGQGAAVWKYNDCHGNNNCVQLPSVSKHAGMQLNSAFIFITFFLIYILQNLEWFSCIFDQFLCSFWGRT